MIRSSRLELLVASGIAVILLAFLIPSVQKLRIASDRTRCIENMRKLGSGAHGYHDAKRRLPPGGSHKPPARSACCAPECRETEWSWAYHLLPFIGQAEAYGNPNPEAVQTAEIKSFYCSARRRHRRGGRTMLDYAANAGADQAGTNGTIQRSTFLPICLGDIPDGPGSTILLAEKRLNSAEFERAPGDTHGFATPGWTDSYEAHRLGHLPPAADIDEPGNLAVFSEFGSSHPGVINALFADGTIRTIRFSVSPSVWRRACVRNDNQNFNLNDL